MTEEERLYMMGLITAKSREKVVEPYIIDLYPETIFKRPCSNCENEDSINICDQCCFNYDSWFKKKKGESE